MSNRRSSFHTGSKILPAGPGLRVRSLLLALLCCAPPGAILAQPDWRFVSAVGSDAGNCTRQAPCRTVGKALTVVPAGGTVAILDSGVFPPFQVTQAVTVTAAPGVYAVVRVPAGIGIPMTTGASDVVVLRGLSVQGVGGEDGAELTGEGVLHVENCHFSGFTRNGFAFRGSGQLFVKDTIVRDNDFGIHVNGVGARASMDRVRFENTGEGLSVWSGIVTVRDSVMSGNQTGVQGGSADGYAEVNVESSVVANNFDGIRSLPQGGQASLVRVANSTVTNNENGLVQGDVGVLLSRGDNTVEGNTTDLVGTIGTFSPK